MKETEIQQCDECKVELALCLGYVNLQNDDEPFDSCKEEEINIDKETRVYCYICPDCNKIKSEILEC